MFAFTISEYCVATFLGMGMAICQVLSISGRVISQKQTATSRRVSRSCSRVVYRRLKGNPAITIIIRNSTKSLSELYFLNFFKDSKLKTTVF